jgi:GT2 family glycosyltransferase
MISVIICSIDDEKFASVEATYRRVLAGAPFEIIRIPDARSMCEGYNHGVANSRGQTLILSHDDIEIHAADFLPRLRGHLERADLVGVAGTTLLCGPGWAWAGLPHVYGQIGQHVRAKPGAKNSKDHFEAAVFAAPARHVSNIQALDGVFLACRRGLAEAVPFDQRTFVGWHHYDIDFSYRAHRAGYKLAVACDLNVIHHSRGEWDEAWKRSAEQFLQKHQSTLQFRSATAWNHASARVATREALIPIFHPPHWTD